MLGVCAISANSWILRHSESERVCPNEAVENCLQAGKQREYRLKLPQRELARSFRGDFPTFLSSFPFNGQNFESKNQPPYQ